MLYYLYQYLDENKNILYIGKTTDIYSRYKAHQREHSQYSNSKYFKWAICKSEMDMDLYEKYLISKYHPKYNILDNNKGECSFILPELKWNEILTNDFDIYFLKQNNIKIKKEKLYRVQNYSDLSTNNNKEIILQKDKSSDKFYIPEIWKEKEILNNLTLIDQKILCFISSFNKQTIYFDFYEIFKYYNMAESWKYNQEFNKLLEQNIISKNKNNTITLQYYSENKIIIPKYYLTNKQSKYFLPFLIYILEDLKNNKFSIIPTEKIYQLFNYNNRERVVDITRFILVPFLQWIKDTNKNYNANIPNIEYTFLKTGRKFSHLKISIISEV